MEDIMNNTSTLLPFVVVVISYFLTAGAVHPKVASAQNDTTFIDIAHAEIEQAGFDKNLQVRYAGEFFSYFLENPETQTGKEAVIEAVLLWINTGTTDALFRSLGQIDYDSEAWYDILQLIHGSNFYNRFEQYDYLQLFNDLAVNLSDGRSRAAAYFLLASHYLRESDREKVTEHYRKVVELDADEFFTNLARRYLHELETLGVGRPAPDFTATTIDGETITLSDQRGKFVILDFWATWCGPCLPEIPILKEIRAGYPEEKLEIISVSLDRDLETLKQFLEENSIDWPQIIQPKGSQDELAVLYNVRGIPQKFVIDTDGTIVARGWRGERLKEEIANLLEE
jgi:peroxiredoxin